ncbi:hypothetical protein P353_16715 [Comamonas testosteroni]|uniref:Uncharacterized protein n=1 Tax=Comamonas testosteroni TaxID=285 RepID=A0A096FDN7_COMTE|nr:hypothetical protein P353_16715 [Comamonas testosteroni]
MAVGNLQPFRLDLTVNVRFTPKTFDEKEPGSKPECLLRCQITMHFQAAAIAVQQSQSTRLERLQCVDRRPSSTTANRDVNLRPHFVQISQGSVTAPAESRRWLVILPATEIGR